MAAAEMRSAWQRTAATCYLLHEDSKRPPKQDNRGIKQEELPKSKHFCEGWSAVNSHYFVDNRKLDFHFHVDSVAEGGEPHSKSFVDVAVESGSVKSLQSDWQSIDSAPSVLPFPEETMSMSDSKLVSDVNWKVEELYKAAKTNVVCSVMDPKLHQPIASKSVDVMEAVPRWRHATKGELAALIARKSSEDMGNCDLPPPLSPGKTAAKDQVLSGRKALDERTAIYPLASSPLTSRSLGSVETKQKRRAAELKQSVASANQAQEENRTSEAMNVNWKGVEGDSGYLGEALCRSQTRAREAEKRAAEAISEKDQLLKLFFREASVSLTYKHWVKFLQAENTWLRLRAGEDELQEFEEEAPLIHSEQQRKRPKGQEVAKARKRKHSDHTVAVLGCTVGLAFALGVSLAGAGLVFGCTMGWILIAF